MEHLSFGDLLERTAIAPRVSAAGKRQALLAIAEIAARGFGPTQSGGSLKSGEILDALLEREAAGSTGVGHGVAVPHARLPGLTRLRAVFVRLEQPVEFGAVDDRPVDLLFALFAPPGASGEHLRALARVSRALRQSTLREHLRQARTADAIRAILVQEATPSAA